MTTLRLPYVQKFRDRHRKWRYYFRRRGRPRVTLPGHPGSQEFMQAYQDAMGSIAPRQSIRFEHGSIGALWLTYCGSVNYANLSASSKLTYNQVVGPVFAKHGHRSVAGMNRQHARQLVEAVGRDTPSMANMTISVLRLLFSYALEAGWRGDNPFRAMRRYKGGEHESWSDSELAQFEKTWPVGTRERQVYDLLLYTAQRGGDVVTWKNSDIIGDEIVLTQGKTGTKLVIPIHEALKRSLQARTVTGVHVLDGPIQRRTLTRIIRLAVRKAGLPPKCVAHGLRKTAMRRLAEAGATEKQIASISGHKSLTEVQRYTSSADQATLARSAMKLMPNGSRTKVSNRG